jgi:SAM-dependent methyltransferase
MVILSDIEGKKWQDLDPIYATVRRKLFGAHEWLLGPLHVIGSAKRVIANLAKCGLDIQNKVYCDLGCGTQHPYGTSTLMYINGADSAIATDLSPLKNNRRTAEALYDLLLQCLAHPDDFHLTQISREEYFSRIYTFNLKALKKGELINGLANIPIRHIVTSIYEPEILPETIDIISSRAVLEHLLEFEKACSQMYSLMKSGGIGIHFVDFVDHRAYKSSEYHYWSFLAEEDEEWSHL